MATKILASQTPLKCTCHHEKVMAVVDGDKLEIRARRDGEEHVLVLTASELRAIAGSVPFSALTQR